MVWNMGRGMGMGRGIVIDGLEYKSSDKITIEQLACILRNQGVI